MDLRFGNLLECPMCAAALEERPQALICAGCGAAYPIAEATQQPDLRLRQPKSRAMEFTIGADLTATDLVQDPMPACDRAQAGAVVRPLSSDLIYGNRLSPELISYFPRGTADDWVLDLGCGDRTFENFCRTATGMSYVGFDYDGDRPDLLADAHALPFRDESFAFIISIAVLEHLAIPDVAMAEAFRVLKPGGRFIGTVAFLETFHMESHFHMTHLGVGRLLRRAGFELEALAPNEGWTALRAQAEMSLFPILPRALQRVIVEPLAWLSKGLWAFKRAVKGSAAASAKQRRLETTGGFRFVARKPALA